MSALPMSPSRALIAWVRTWWRRRHTFDPGWTPLDDREDR